MKLTLLLCAAMALLLAGPASAGSATADPLAPRPGAPGGHGPVKVMVIVNSRGLDLSSSADADKFLRRVDVAVNRVCDDRPAGSLLTLGRSAQFHACRAKAYDQAMTYVRTPAVKQRFAQLRAAEALRVAHR